MKRLVVYLCDNTPTEEEIEEAIQIAKNDKCIVKLLWSSGKKSVLVYSWDTSWGVQGEIEVRNRK